MQCKSRKRQGKTGRRTGTRDRCASCLRRWSEHVVENYGGHCDDCMMRADELRGDGSHIKHNHALRAQAAIYGYLRNQRSSKTWRRTQ